MGNDIKKTATERTETSKPPFEDQLDIHTVNSYPKRKNNTVRTFMEGKDFYTALQERCESAEYSIWCSVSFGSWSFQFPNGQYWWQFFKELKQKNPSLTIRVLFWRNIDDRWGSNGVIMGTEKDDQFIKKNQLHQFDNNDKTPMLEKGIQFKWDESPEPAHCHHGKYFVIDAEKQNNLQNIYSFVGGMTLNKIVYNDSRHDTVIEVNGASSIDVINNFKLRWNNNNIFNKSEAMDTCKPFVTDISINIGYDVETDEENENSEQPMIDQKDEPQNDEEKKDNQDKMKGVMAQVAATIYPKIYPGYDLGESSIHYQYYKAFLNAKKSIYLESQHPGDVHLLKIMKWKLENIKDFKIIFLVPIHMMHPIVTAKRESLAYIKQCNEAEMNNKIEIGKEPRYHGMFSTLSSLKQFDNFVLAGMYKSCKVDEKVFYESIYVHSKLCIVDGEWFTIGSANFVDISFIHDHSEINVAVFDETESMKLMRTLANKHCEKNDKTFIKMDHAEIVDYMIKAARNNMKSKSANDVLDGRLYALDPELYAS